MSVNERIDSEFGISKDTEVWDKKLTGEGRSPDEAVLLSKLQVVALERIGSGRAARVIEIHTISRFVDYRISI